MNKFKEKLKQIRDLVFPPKEIFYSQCGEDAIIKHYLKGVKEIQKKSLRYLLNKKKWNSGFYVDIGAYSPKKYSNTYYFYKKGWHGITIEPSSSSSWMFKYARNRDTHLQILIDIENGLKEFVDDGYSLLNRIEKKSENENTRKIKSYKLETILDYYIEKDQIINLMSIDCEGNDLNVLKSNNWVSYRPQVLCVEDSKWNRLNKFTTEISKYLEGVGYRPIGWAGISVIYEDLKIKH